MTGTITNVLAADDNADDVFFLRQAFRKSEAASRLHVVSDGVEARAYLEGRDAYADRTVYPFPEILLLDLNMPRMNGFEVLEWIRQDPRCRNLIVHVLTASAREADVQRAYELHANSYVMKPNRLDDLVAFVSALHQWHRFTVLVPQPESEAAALLT